MGESKFLYDFQSITVWGKAMSHSLKVEQKFKPKTFANNLSFSVFCDFSWFLRCLLKYFLIEDVSKTDKVRPETSIRKGEVSFHCHNNKVKVAFSVAQATFLSSPTAIENMNKILTACAWVLLLLYHFMAMDWWKKGWPKKRKKKKGAKEDARRLFFF